MKTNLKELSYKQLDKKEAKLRNKLMCIETEKQSRDLSKLFDECFMILDELRKLRAAQPTPNYKKGTDK